MTRDCRGWVWALKQLFLSQRRRRRRRRRKKMAKCKRKGEKKNQV
jgi:hypothetical protein